MTGGLTLPSHGPTAGALSPHVTLHKGETGHSSQIRALDLRPLEQSLGIHRVRMPYSPRSWFKPYHARKQRFSILVVSRRGGKTVAEINEDVRKVVTNKRIFPPPQVAFISPTFGQGKRNAWPYLKHYTQSIPGMKYAEAELTAIFPNGGKIILAGSDNYESLRGLYLDHASMDEIASQDPRVWPEVVRPALSDYGGSATFIGSAKGRNHLYDLLQTHTGDPNWYTDILPLSKIKHLSPEEESLARQSMTEAQFMQEFECSFDAAVSGTFYGSLMAQAREQGRITSVPYDPMGNVYASLDLGIGNEMAAWVFQIIGKEWHFLRCHSRADVTLQYFADWFLSLPFKINELYLPHDAAARSLETGRTRQQFLEARGLRCFLLKRENIADGINAVRMILPRAWFDAKECHEGIEALSMHRSVYDEKKKVYSETPLHDWTSDLSDSMRYACMGAQEYVRGAFPTEPRYENRVGREAWLA